MKFEDWEQNKITKFTLEDGDATVSVEYKYRLETLEDFLKAITVLAANYDFTEQDIKNYYYEQSYE